jgi:hypothetical protein
MGGFMRSSWKAIFWTAALSLLAGPALLPHIAHAQAADCNQITDIYAIADWRTLATGPFVEMQKGETFRHTRADAKSLLVNFDRCILDVTDNSSGTTNFSYVCKAPNSTGRGKDYLAAAQAVATQWKSCFAGWSERPSSMAAMGTTMATMEFRSADKEKKVWFLREGVESEPEPVKIVLFRNLRK